MRGPVALCLLLALAACQQEPTFDERYDAASKQIGTSAKEMDAELEKREAEAAEAEIDPNDLELDNLETGEVIEEEAPQPKG